MKKASLKKLLITFSALTLIGYGTILACADSDYWGWSADSNFSPETFVDQSYAPLFFSSDFFYKIGYDTQHPSRFNSEIIKDWSGYLENKIKEKDLNYFLTDSSSADVSDLALYYKKGKANKATKKWSSIIPLEDGKIKDFVLFLSDAQIVETYSTHRFDSWSYDPAQKPASITDNHLLKSIESKYRNHTDSFLKNRYWFLTIKSHFYSKNKEAAIKFFNSTHHLVPKNSLYYRALSYMAGIEYARKNYAKSNYLYSQVFDKCPAMRVVAAYSFHPQQQSDWKQALSMAKTPSDKAALWAIQGYYNDPEKAISEIYKLQPLSPHLDYLLTRIINIEEHKIAHLYQDKSLPELKKATKDSISKSKFKLVSRIAAAEKTDKPYLWNLAAGYLETLTANYQKAEHYYEKAKSTMPKTPLAIHQVRLLRFINSLSKINQPSELHQKSLLEDLKWLYFELPNSNIESLRYQNATAWSKKYLAALYRLQNNSAMVELFDPNPNFYDDDSLLSEMKNFLSKAKPTELEKIAIQNYHISLADINYFLAVKATYENKIPLAISLIKESGPHQKTILPGNPFLGGIKDCHDCDHRATQKKKYSSLEFLLTLKSLQENIHKKSDVYNNSLLLANAFYNISFFGNARVFYQGKIAGSASTPDMFRKPIRLLTTNTTLAKNYYQQAFEAAKNNQQRAKMHYMLAKCERNDYYNTKYYETGKTAWEIADDSINFIAWQGFKNLKDKYAKTPFYKEVINECGYFRTYVQK